MTMFLNYGEAAYQRQGEIIKGLATPQPENQSTNVSERVKAIPRNAQQRNGDAGLVKERLHCLKKVMGNALVHIFTNSQPFD